MNPVLKKAGVVDAGGKGFLVILEGMLAELRGEPMPAGDEAEAAPRSCAGSFRRVIRIRALRPVSTGRPRPARLRSAM